MFSQPELCAEKLFQSYLSACVTCEMLTRWPLQQGSVAKQPVAAVPLPLRVYAAIALLHGVGPRLRKRLLTTWHVLFAAAKPAAKAQPWSVEVRSSCEEPERPEVVVVDDARFVEILVELLDLHVHGLVRDERNMF